ncbi:MAG: DUF4333 domain-containing protein [Kofleriaceae bacterium]|nr:DUF4333 domain-containing protein [Kofleriaceae bacterium]
MSRSRSLFSLLLVAVVLNAPGCKTVAKGDVFEADLVAALTSAGRAVERVDCPDRIPLGRVNRFRCQATLQGGAQLGLDVELDADGALGWKAAALP